MTSTTLSGYNCYERYNMYMHMYLKLDSIYYNYKTVKTCSLLSMKVYIIHVHVFSDNPQALLNLIWLNNGMFFGLRGRQDHLNMLWGDIQLKKTSAGKEFLEFNGKYC